METASKAGGGVLTSGVPPPVPTKEAAKPPSWSGAGGAVRPRASDAAIEEAAERLQLIGEPKRLFEILQKNSFPLRSDMDPSDMNNDYHSSDGFPSDDEGSAWASLSSEDEDDRVNENSAANAPLSNTDNMDDEEIVKQRRQRVGMLMRAYKNQLGNLQSMMHVRQLRRKRAAEATEEAEATVEHKKKKKRGHVEKEMRISRMGMQCAHEAEGGGQCKAHAMPLSQYCFHHILQDKDQCLYTKCSVCENPAVAVPDELSNPLCVWHGEEATPEKIKGKGQVVAAAAAASGAVEGAVEDGDQNVGEAEGGTTGIKVEDGGAQDEEHAATKEEDTKAAVGANEEPAATRDAPAGTDTADAAPVADGAAEEPVKVEEQEEKAEAAPVQEPSGDAMQVDAA